jgi:mannose-6-phosphate isomerase-like protein (cupin superfamily)
MSARPSRLVWFAAAPNVPQALSPLPRVPPAPSPSPGVSSALGLSPSVSSAVSPSSGVSSALGLSPSVSSAVSPSSDVPSALGPSPGTPPPLGPSPGVPPRLSALPDVSPAVDPLPGPGAAPARSPSLSRAVERFERLLAAPEPIPTTGEGSHLSVEQLERFAAVLAADPDRWRHLVRHERDARVYEQIFSDERVNAWLICWSDGHDTGFHDHDESAGGIAVISGRVRDERLAIGSGPVTREVAAGECFNVPATAIHRVLHDGTEPAITIHAYSPPLNRMGSYRVGPRGELEREALSYEQELRAAVAAA